ncbi:MAG TPA: hypothetical protein PLK89_17065, partial [Acidobacteriota bacterium]|nr:hypothetical protein [Acidobacteriota bacterium]
MRSSLLFSFEPKPPVPALRGPGTARRSARALSAAGAAAPGGRRETGRDQTSGSASASPAAVN